MTKNTKKLLGLVGALAVLGGAYGGIVWINQNNEEKAAEQSKAEKDAVEIPQTTTSVSRRIVITLFSRK